MYPNVHRSTVYNSQDMAHLYEFPCEEHDASKIENRKSKIDFPFTHVLSHQRLHARFITHKVKELPHIEGTTAIKWSDLDNYALSRLTLKALDKLMPGLRN